MPTTINSASIGTSDPRLPAASGVTPGSASDGRYTWTVVEQSTDGTQLVLRAVGPGTVSSVTPIGNTITATMAASVTSAVSYVTLRVSYSATSNGDNWTVNVGSAGQTTQRFKKGNGGGSARRTGSRTTKETAV